jgi:hypothetical protein
MRDRFGIVPRISFEDGIARLHQFLRREKADGVFDHP